MRPAFVAYLTEDLRPAEQKDAALVKVMFDGGETVFVAPSKDRGIGDARPLVSKASVGYEAVARNPDHQCRACAHFRGNRRCSRVAGVVSPLGWCELFAPDRVGRRLEVLKRRRTGG